VDADAVALSLRTRELARTGVTVALLLSDASLSRFLRAQGKLVNQLPGLPLVVG